MTNLLLIIFFVIFFGFINCAFIIYVVPKIVTYVDKVLKGELFLSVFEFFFAVFSICIFTALMLFLIFKINN